MANLVVCCDGTWNTPDQRDRGVPAPTNVPRLYGAVAELDARGTPQQRYYHPGVGTDGTLLDRLAGGGLGRGLDLNIISAYGWLCDRYRPGDDVWLFGFSRGAYTVRSLCGLVTYAGLLANGGLDDAEKWRRVERVFQQGYRRKVEGRADWLDAGWTFRPGGDGQGPDAPVPIHFIGVWDTVGALGIPDDMAVLNVIDRLHDYTFHDTDLSPAVLHARHALALDEIRAAFQPTLWTGVRGHQDVRQLWFAGAHLDVDASVHPSVVQRRTAPPIDQAPYRAARPGARGQPTVVDVFARHPWNDTGLWLTAGQAYTFGAAGQWLDSSIRCGPAGCADGHFQLGEVAQFAGTVLGKAEATFQRLTGNQAADFRFTRRHENLPWFSLVGAIANGAGVDAKGHLQAHECFAIGAGCTWVPRRSGYLYAYANDAWNCYGNNRGTVTLTVTAN